MSGFEVVVLGASGTYPADGAAASGFLLRSGQSRIWLDAGTGTFANLQRHAGVHDLEALMLSHLHLDHILDIYPFYYALRFGPQTRGPQGLPVYSPPGTEDRLKALVASTGNDGFGGYFDFRPIASGEHLKIGAFDFRFQKTNHPIETMAMRIETSGRSLIYTADTAPSGEVAELARDADVMIAEASMQAPVESLASVHMTAEEAGTMAKQAAVGRLVLSHIVPGQDPQVSVDQARSIFEGEVLAAHDHLELEI